jgi:hypothetical protein
MPLVEGTSEPDSGWLEPPPLAPAASIGGPWRARFFLLVFGFGLAVLIEPLWVVVLGIEPPPAPAAPLVAGVVWALAIAAVADMARMSAAA